MKRSTWIAVVITAAVLVAAGNLPRVRWSAPAGGWADTAAGRVQAWLHAPRRAAAAAPVSHLVTPRARAARPDAPIPAIPRLLVTPIVPRTGATWPVPAGLLGVLLVLAVALALPAAFVLHAWRDRRGRVFQMARRGLPAERIARSTRVPQDAVRTLLTPGLGARR